MSSFTSPLKVEVYDCGRVYILTESFCYYREDKSKKDIIVPKGFMTDFASTPRILWSVLPPFGRYAKCAVLHDYLCEEFHKGKCNRNEADRIFLESMEAISIPFFTKWSLYLGVRIYALLKGYK